MEIGMSAFGRRGPVEQRAHVLKGLEPRIADVPGTFFTLESLRMKASS